MYIYIYIYVYTYIYTYNTHTYVNDKPYFDYLLEPWDSNLDVFRRRPA